MNEAVFVKRRTTWVAYQYFEVVLFMTGENSFVAYRWTGIEEKKHMSKGKTTIVGIMELPRQLSPVRWNGENLILPA